MAEPVLSVCLITYNHAKYIRKAIEGVLMQKVNFSWELIIADDFSTDGTRDIISEYKKKFPNFIKLILQEKNVGPAKNWFDLINAPKSKYIAYFEGDDYWTDPYKLQKQVDYMESHPECSLCFHAVEISENNKKTGRVIRWSNSDKVLDNNKMFGIGSYSPTVSLLFRKRIIDNIPDWVVNAPVGDIPLKLLLSQHGSVFYINEVMAVRRVGTAGSWSRQLSSYEFRKKLYLKMIKMLEEFNKYTIFKYSDEVVELQLINEMKGSKFLLFHLPTVLKIINNHSYQKYVAKLSLKNKLILYLKCFLINVQAQIMTWRVCWAIKKIISYKKSDYEPRELGKDR